MAVDGGLYHPNCRHRVTTYFYDLKEEQRKLEDDGIEITHEEQGARKKRLLEQKEKRLKEGKLDNNNIQNRNQNKNKEQYERYKRVLGDEFTPDTFEKFQGMNYNDVDKWKKIQSKYRIVNQYQNHTNQKNEF